jgi:GNAT superfamily N-acetyltransferase
VKTYHAVAMIIRPATADDAPRLAQLRWDFRSAARAVLEEPEQEFVERCTTWMRRRLARDNSWSAWIAEENATAVGQIWVQIFEKIPNPTDEPEEHAYISNLYVTPSARGGLGTQLLDACLGWIESRGIDRVVLWPSPRSRTLYERHGFQADHNLFERRGQR